MIGIQRVYIQGVRFMKHVMFLMCSMAALEFEGSINGELHKNVSKPQNNLIRILPRTPITLKVLTILKVLKN